MFCARIVVLLPVLALCACQTKVPDPGDAGAPLPAVRLEAPATLLLPSLGATTRLAVRAFDAEGRPTALGDASFTSSAEDIVRVASDGTLTALRTGLARVTVTLGTLRARTTVLVARPVPGAVLVSDEQVEGTIRPLDPAASLDVGLRYEVTLRGVSVQPGNLVIGTGVLPLGGRVVAVNGDAVTLEVVALDELFPDFEFEETITLADEPFELNPEIESVFDVTRQPGGALSLAMKPGVILERRGKRTRNGKTEFSVGPVKCVAEVSAFQLSFSKLEFLVDPGLTVERTWSEAHKRVVLTSNATASVTVKPSLQSQLEGKLTCELELARRHLPLPGPIGLVLGFAVPFGVGFELEAKVPLNAGASVEFKKEVKVRARGGFDCAASCEKVAEFTDTSPPATVTPRVAAWELPKDLKAEVSGYVFGYAKLEFGASQVVASAAGAVGWRRLDAELLVLKMGLKLEGKFADGVAQATDPMFANEYRLLFEAGLEPGAAVEAFIHFVKITLLKLELKVTNEIATSPRATVRVSPATYNVGDEVTFKVSLTPSSLEFPLIGFNAKRVRVYKITTGPEPQLVLVAEAPVTKGQNDLSLRAVATESGRASNFAVFIETGLLDLDCEIESVNVLELSAGFPQTIPAGAATPLVVTASFRNVRTDATVPAPDVAITVDGGMNASVSPASGSTDMQGQMRTSVTPAPGATSLTLTIKGTATDGSHASADLQATVSSGATCLTATPRTVSGSVFLNSAADVMAAADIGEITDTLQIQGSGAAYAVDLPCLRSVGTLIITGGAVTSVNLPALTTVAITDVRAISTTALVSLRLPALTTVGERIVIGTFNSIFGFMLQGNAALSELVIGPARCGSRNPGTGNLTIIGNPQLTSLTGISSNVNVTAGFTFGLGAAGNGFDEAAALALANRITITGNVCSATGTTAPHCYMGPPYAP
ncbi:MAG: hypothetical protein AB1938_25070 [Myxococcota bacterium]